MSNNGEITPYLYPVQDDIEACYPLAETIPDGNRQVPVLYAINRRPAGKLFGSEGGPNLYEVYPDGSYPISRPDLPCAMLRRRPRPPAAARETWLPSRPDRCNPTDR